MGGMAQMPVPLPIGQLQTHPNFRLPDPRSDEHPIEYAMRCAAHLVSPPKLIGEDEDTPCEDVAKAIIELTETVMTKWKWHGMDLPKEFE